jgi:antirestriction protein ArdC
MKGEDLGAMRPAGMHAAVFTNWHSVCDRPSLAIFRVSAHPQH